VHYGHSDTDPAEGLSYYRVVEVDHNGVRAATHSIPVLFGDQAVAPPFPNPCTDDLRWMDAAIGRSSRVVVTDALGRTVLAQPLAEGAVSVQLRTADLPPGVYGLHAEDRNGARRATTTFLKR
jgi:hypothetical protein